MGVWRKDWDGLGEERSSSRVFRLQAPPLIRGLEMRSSHKGGWVGLGLVQEGGPALSPCGPTSSLYSHFQTVTPLLLAAELAIPITRRPLDDLDSHIALLESH